MKDKIKINTRFIEKLELKSDKIYVLFVPDDVLSEETMTVLNAKLQQLGLKVLAIHCPATSHLEGIRAVEVDKDELEGENI